MEPAKMTNGVDPRLNEQQAEAIGMFLLALILGVVALFRPKSGSISPAKRSVEHTRRKQTRYEVFGVGLRRPF
jgi:hypothetical protein